MFRFLQRKNKITSLINLLPDKSLIKFIDIGAADGLSNKWKDISQNLHYFAFEPDERSDLDNNINHFGKIDIFRKAVWKTNEPVQFNLTRKEQNSSCYKPNISFLKNFPDIERFTIENTLDLIPVKISDLNIGQIDFIKLDIQGGELNVLQGIGNKLTNTIGLEIEVEFLELYKNQPTYGDLNNFLLNFNFEFFDFTTLTKWERDNLNSEFGQCIFADALFLKKPEDIINNTTTNNNLLITKYIIICLVYNKLDLIIVLKKYLDISNNKDYSLFFIHFLKYRSKFNFKYKLIKKINKFINYLINMFI
jgi:FkbM family methyltransferase